jgi:hypothetical protein
MSRNDRRRHTEPVEELILGNELFERAVAAIGFDGSMVRPLLAQVMKSIGAGPQSLTPDELGTLIPEIERRLRLAVPSDSADQAARGLMKLLLSWDQVPAE